MGKWKKRAPNEMRFLKNKLRDYFRLVNLNENEGFGRDKYPRSNKPIPHDVDLRNMSPIYLQNCLVEEEAYRQKAKEYQKLNIAADISLRKTYEHFDKEIKERERILRENAERKLQDAYWLFDKDSFSQEMIHIGLEPKYIEFDMWASRKEIEEIDFKRDMVRMRRSLDQKLKDYSEEVNKDTI